MYIISTKIIFQDLLDCIYNFFCMQNTILFDECKQDFIHQIFKVNDRNFVYWYFQFIWCGCWNLYYMIDYMLELLCSYFLPIFCYCLHFFHKWHLNIFYSSQACLGDHCYWEIWNIRSEYCQLLYELEHKRIPHFFGGVLFRYKCLSE